MYNYVIDYGRYMPSTKKKSNKLLNIINVENKLKLNNLLTWKNFNKKIIKHSIELNKCLEFCSKKTKRVLDTFLYCLKI